MPVKYGFGQLLDEVRLREQTNIERRLRRGGLQFAQLGRAQCVCMALEDLGPTFIKMGQFLSTRPGLVPHDYIPELEKLQSRASPLASHVAREAIESELGRPADEVFASFDDEPVAAASGWRSVYYAVGPRSCRQGLVRLARAETQFPSRLLAYGVCWTSRSDW